MNYYETQFKENLKWTIFWLLWVFALCCVMASCSYADCSGLKPELQKAYDQLKHDGFNVTCRRGL